MWSTPWPENWTKISELGCGCVEQVENPVSVPTSEEIGSLAHLHGGVFAWKASMETVVLRFWDACYSFNGMILRCGICPNEHGFEHCTSKKHFDFIWHQFLFSKLEECQKGKRSYHLHRSDSCFWQQVLVKGGGLRFNHVDGAVEIFAFGDVDVNGGCRIPPPLSPSMRFVPPSLLLTRSEGTSGVSLSCAAACVKSSRKESKVRIIVPGRQCVAVGVSGDGHGVATVGKSNLPRSAWPPPPPPSPPPPPLSSSSVFLAETESVRISEVVMRAGMSKNMMSGASARVAPFVDRLDDSRGAVSLSPSSVESLSLQAKAVGGFDSLLGFDEAMAEIRERLVCEFAGGGSCKHLLFVVLDSSVEVQKEEGVTILAPVERPALQWSTSMSNSVSSSGDQCAVPSGLGRQFSSYGEFKLGDKVNALFHGGWYPGIVWLIYNQDSIQVLWDEDGTVSDLTRSEIQLREVSVFGNMHNY